MTGGRGKDKRDKKFKKEQERKAREAKVQEYLQASTAGRERSPEKERSRSPSPSPAAGKKTMPKDPSPGQGWEQKHWSAYRGQNEEDVKSFYTLFQKAGHSITERTTEFAELTKAAFVNEVISKIDFADLRREFAYQGLNLALIVNIFIHLGQLAHGTDSKAQAKIGSDLMHLLVFFVLRGTNISGAIGKKQGTLDSARETLKVLAKRYHIVSPKHRNNDPDLLNGKPTAESITLGRLAAAFPIWTAKAAFSILNGTPEEKCRKFAKTPHAWLVFNMIPELNELGLEARVEQAKKIATKEKPFDLKDVIQYSSMTMPVRKSEVLEFLKFCKWPSSSLLSSWGKKTFEVDDKTFVLYDEGEDSDVEEACEKFVEDHDWAPEGDEEEAT